MELITTQGKRIFRFTFKNQDQELADIGIDHTPQQVCNFYANTFPILTTARIQGPQFEDDNIIYRFVPNLGTKG